MGNVKCTGFLRREWPDFLWEHLAVMKKLFRSHAASASPSRKRFSSRGRKQSGSSRRPPLQQRREQPSLARAESLEPKLAMDAAGIALGSQITLLVSDGDDLYVQQVATSPQELRYSTDSSFLSISPNDSLRGRIPSVDLYDTIRIVNGMAVSDTRLLAAEAPVYNPANNGTNFVLSRVELSSSGEMRGTFSCTQPDGERSFWTFASPRSGGGFDLQNLRIISGPGYDSSLAAKPGYFIPTAVATSTNGNIDTTQYVDGIQTASLQIRWNQRPIAFNNITLDAISYSHSDDGLFFNGNADDNNFRYTEPSALQPSAPTNASFLLTGTQSTAVSGVVPGTLEGSIVIGAFAPIRFTTRAGSNALIFANGESEGFSSEFGAGVFGPRAKYVTGSYSDDGVIRLRFFTRSNSSSAAQDPGPVSVSATYGVFEASSKAAATAVSIFAGQDLTTKLDIDLSGLGSSINIDSPVRMRSTLTGDVSLRASNVTLNSPVKASNQVLIGGSASPQSSFTQQAEARALINTIGEVVQLFPSTTTPGLGYDPFNLPTVTIAAPRSAPASATVNEINGSVTQLSIVNSGRGYTTAPTIFIDPPNTPTGIQATAVATINSAGQVTSVRWSGGSGYTFTPRVFVEAPPAAEEGAPPNIGAVLSAAVTGTLTSIRVINQGFGYTSAPRVTIQGSGQNAAATATIDEFGRVLAIQVERGGTGYGFDTVVSIDSPPETVPDAKPATAKANVDANGRIVSYEIIDGGKGYGLPPTVVISPPVKSVIDSAARAIVGTNGVVTGIELPGDPIVTMTSPGTGYRSADLISVTISPPRDSRGVVRPGGRAARAVPLVDNGSIVGIRITDPGFGYLVNDTPPTVTIIDNSLPVAERGRNAQARALIVAGSGFPTDADEIAKLVEIALPPRGANIAKVAAEIDYDPVSGKGSRGISKITLTNGGSGYDPKTPPAVYINGRDAIPVAEKVVFNALVEAPVFDIRVADDFRTDASPDEQRGTLRVSQTGSLRSSSGLADSVFIEAAESDVFIEGEIAGSKQSYLLQSPDIEQLYDRSPYTMTTIAPSTGSRVGLIRGQVVSVTLGNAGPIPTQDSDWITAQKVDLDTEISSLRIRAANKAGQTIAEAFPYELTVRERSDIQFDAVAASSRTISLAAEGSIGFTSSLTTAGDLAITAGNNFSVTAPVSTTRGRVTISGDNVSVLSSLRVTNPVVDETRDDITLIATEGDVLLQGAVEAKNNVRITQRNRLNPDAVQYSNRLPAAINDNSTAIQSIVVTDAFTFDDLNVLVDLTHTFVGDLSLTLISPDGSRFRLFSRGGGSGDNFVGTIFDSEAVNSIVGAVAPFTGAFRPIDSLVPLYGRSVQGTWRLEVQDSAGTDVGILTNFTLAFRNSLPQKGKVSGSALVSAKRLTIEAAGSVGNHSLRPADPGFSLRTAVDVLRADVVDNVAIDELDRLRIESLRATGRATLRAGGTDGGVASLTGTLVDITGLDASAPNGSIDLSVNTAKTLFLGDETALRLGRSLNNTAAGNVRIQSLNSDIVSFDAPLAGRNARQVRFASPGNLMGTYSAGRPGVQASTLRGTGNLVTLLNLPTGTQFTPNDRILLHQQGSPSQNGIYTVTAYSATSWTLTRAADADTLSELESGTYVRVLEGTSGMHRITHSASAATFGATAFSVTPVTISTKIGVTDPTDLVTFVVSTIDGTNSAPGSLGKMLGLIQENAAENGNNAPQRSELRFASSITGPIRLTQELPEIQKPITIDGRNRYVVAGFVPNTIVVDGSRINTTRAGGVSATSSEINGFEFTAASGASGNTAGASLLGITIGGFSQGAAVRINNASGIELNSLTLGRDAAGVRLSNKFGVHATGNVGRSVVFGSTIVGSTDAGILINTATESGLTIVGSTIGSNVLGNGDGIRVLNGTSQIGVDLLSTSTHRVTMSLNQNIIQLPATLPLSSIHLGQSISGSGLPAGTVISAINGTSITLSRRATAAGTFNVAFGQPARNAVQNNLIGIVLGGGRTTVTNTNVNNNTFDGIRITGGIQTIGTSTTLGNTSNAVFGNGGWGVNMMLNPSDAGRQQIRNNYFGSVVRGTTGAANTLGNVAVNSALAPAALGFNPTIPANTVIVVDKWRNQYARPSTTGGSSTLQPWRPR